MRKNDGLHFMMLFVIATVCCPSKAVPQAGSSSGTPQPKVTEGKLLQRVAPIYPPIAKAQRLQGVVVLQAVIGKDGLLHSITVVSGPPLLQQAAIDAVKQWKYQPYLLGGEPVEIKTQVNLQFALDGVAPSQQNQAAAQTTAEPAESHPNSSSASMDSPKRLSVLGIYRGETLDSAVKAITSLGFRKSVCSNPYSPTPPTFQCFTRGADEEVALDPKDGIVWEVHYYFSGSKYNGIWNSLNGRFGNPHAFIYRGGWDWDFWRDKERKDSIDILKVDGTGIVNLVKYDIFYDPATETSSSPSQYSKPISGKLNLKPVQNKPNRVDAGTPLASARQAAQRDGILVDSPARAAARRQYAALLQSTLRQVLRSNPGYDPSLVQLRVYTETPNPENPLPPAVVRQDYRLTIETDAVALPRDVTALLRNSSLNSQPRNLGFTEMGIQDTVGVQAGTILCAVGFQQNGAHPAYCMREVGADVVQWDVYHQWPSEYVVQDGH